jgi:hypothetical protein
MGGGGGWVGDSFLMFPFFFLLQSCFAVVQLSEVLHPIAHQQPPPNGLHACGRSQTRAGANGWGCPCQCGQLTMVVFSFRQKVGTSW